MVYPVVIELMKAQQTILIVDPLRSDARALAAILSSDWAVLTALSGKEALQIAATENPPDLILLGVCLPKMDGYEVCERLKSSSNTCTIPVLFISAPGADLDEAYGLSLGAVDYIIKPFHPPIVTARIRNQLTLRQTLAELELKNRELEELAAHDKLTGLYNRRKLDELFAQEIARAERYDRPLSIILLDIDHFKSINDAQGHPAGDAVLRETATRLTGALRMNDLPGRWGGEEFLILCPETSAEAAMKLAERIRKDYEARAFPAVGKQTASFGVATHRKGRCAEEILLRADQALYRAKKNGRNRVEPEYHPITP